LGGGGGGVGAVVAGAGALMQPPTCRAADAYERELCHEQSERSSTLRNERQSQQVALAGLGTMLIGGIIYLTGSHIARRQPGTWHLKQPASPLPSSVARASRPIGASRWVTRGTGWQLIRR
jgi:hypothetical protein